MNRDRIIQRHRIGPYEPYFIQTAPADFRRFADYPGVPLVAKDPDTFHSIPPNQAEIEILRAAAEAGEGAESLLPPPVPKGPKASKAKRKAVPTSPESSEEGEEIGSDGATSGKQQREGSPMDVDTSGTAKSPPRLSAAEKGKAKATEKAAEKVLDEEKEKDAEKEKLSEKQRERDAEKEKELELAKNDAMDDSEEIAADVAPPPVSPPRRPSQPPTSVVDTHPPRSPPIVPDSQSRSSTLTPPPPPPPPPRFPGNPGFKFGNPGDLSSLNFAIPVNDSFPQRGSVKPVPHTQPPQDDAMGSRDTSPGGTHVKAITEPPSTESDSASPAAPSESAPKKKRKGAPGKKRTSESIAKGIATREANKLIKANKLKADEEARSVTPDTPADKAAKRLLSPTTAATSSRATKRVKATPIDLSPSASEGEADTHRKTSLKPAWAKNDGDDGDDED